MDMDPAYYKAAARTVLISSAVALGTMLVEFAWLMRDEIKLIWPRIRSTWHARIYMCFRYLGLISQIFNVYFSVRVYLGIHTSATGCRVWLAYQSFVSQSLLYCVEGLLMYRVYGLFLHSQTVLWMLISFIVAQISASIASTTLSVSSNEFTESCFIVKITRGNALFSTATMTTTVVMFFMTSWRYFRLPRSWTQGGVGWVVIRDSGLSLLAIIVIMVFLTLCYFQVIRSSMSGNIVFCWFLCTLWVSLGRLIVNHVKLPQDDQGDGSTWKGTVQLTSQIEMGDSVLSIDSACSVTDGPAESTLQESISTHMTKASQLSPSSVCTSHGPPTWFGDVPDGYVQRSKSPRSLGASGDASTLPGSSRASGSGSRVEVDSRADGDVCGRPSASPRPPDDASEPPEASSSRASEGASHAGDPPLEDAGAANTRDEPGPSPSPDPSPSHPRPSSPAPLETSES